MEIVVKGRRTDVSERYRTHVRDKLARLSKLDGKAFRIDVEVSHESNPRLSGMCERIELTVYSRGPVIRAEAAAGDVYAALDMATAKLEERMRRAADRRHARQHGQVHGAGAQRGAPPVDLPAELPEVALNGSTGATDTPARPAAAEPPVEAAAPAPRAESPADSVPEPEDLGNVLLAEGPLVVRQKVHKAPPMTLEEALHHMELVGHDFFLYCDSDSGLPSVVYRRRGYTYGLLRLQTEAAPASTAPAAASGASMSGASASAASASAGVASTASTG